MLETGCQNSCSVVDIVQKQFLCCFDIKQISLTELFRHIKELPYEECIQHQDSLLNGTIGSLLVKSYPIKVSYQRAFLKRILTEAEDSDIAHPAIYDFYVELLSQDSKEHSTHHRHFIVGDTYITLQESSSIISQGTTGLCTWQGAVYLADWSINNPQLFKGKKVLELGSGIGLTGLALCLSEAPPETYTFSDCHPEVLKQLEKNILLNVQRYSQSTNGKIKDTKVQVACLNWEEVGSRNFESSYSPDVVIAADVVYDNSLFIPLCKTLKHFLSNEGVTGILACTVRDQDTLNEFLRLLDSEKFIVEKQPDHKPEIFCCPLGANVHFYKVTYGSNGDGES